MNKTFEEKWLREFAARVENRMMYLGLNQTELAKQTKVSNMTVCKWLHGENAPNAINIVRLAHALAVKPSYLIDFSVE